MALYTNITEFSGKGLAKVGDRFSFKLNGIIYEYVVKVDGDNRYYLNLTQDGSNRIIFDRMKHMGLVTKPTFKSWLYEIYEESPSDGVWPPAKKLNDLTQAILEIYRILAEYEGSIVKKSKRKAVPEVIIMALGDLKEQDLVSRECPLAVEIYIPWWGTMRYKYNEVYERWENMSKTYSDTNILKVLYKKILKNLSVLEDWERDILFPYYDEEIEEEQVIGYEEFWEEMLTAYICDVSIKESYLPCLSIYDNYELMKLIRSWIDRLSNNKSTSVGDGSSSNNLNNKHYAGKAVKVQRPPDEIRSGEKRRGCPISGRRSRTKFGIGHLSHKKITG